jgi:hypothetical protein
MCVGEGPSWESHVTIPPQMGSPQHAQQSPEGARRPYGSNSPERAAAAAATR